MVQQYRQVIATAPDGLGHDGPPGDAALMPIAELAQEAGRPHSSTSTSTCLRSRAFGGGYVGAVLYNQGLNLGNTAVKDFGLWLAIRPSYSATSA